MTAHVLLSSRQSFHLQLAAFVSIAIAFTLIPASFFTAAKFDLCLFQLLFNIECPGCGTTRAISHIFHGDFATAWAYNPLGFFWVGAASCWLVYLFIKSRAHQTTAKQ